MPPIQSRPSPFVTSSLTPNNIAVLTPDNDTYNLSVGQVWARKPGFVVIGDSLAGSGKDYMDGATITAVGTEATVTVAATSFVRKSLVYITKCDQSEYNGVFRVKTYVGVNTFKIDLLSAPSITTATGTRTVHFPQSHSSRSIFERANQLAGNKGIYLGNFAVPGENSNHFATQLAIALNPANNEYGATPDLVFINMGINDYSVPLTFAGSIANFTTAINTIKGVGAVPIFLTTPPVSNANANWSIGRVTLGRQINDWLLNTAPSLGAIAIDSNEICIDDTTQYGDWLTAYSDDGLHQNNSGAALIAELVKTEFWDGLTVADARESTNVTSSVTLGGTGGTGGAGITGDIAANCTVAISAGSAVCSKGLAPKGGESQILEFTPVAEGNTLNFRSTSSPHTSISAGDKVYCQCRVRVISGSANIKNITLENQIVVDGATRTPNGTSHFTGTTLWVEDGMVLDLETPLFVMPSGISEIKARLEVVAKAASALKIELSDYGVYKLTV